MTPRVFSFPPVDAPDARVLILGSMPGLASLRLQQYYGHPRNAFWPVVGSIAGFDPTLPYAERITALRRAGIALWDVLAACVRPGSLDAAIDPASVVPNDIGGWLERHPGVERILFNGATAEQMFRRHVLPGLPADGVPALHRMPSTSPAHAGLSLERKRMAWASVLAVPRPVGGPATSAKQGGPAVCGADQAPAFTFSRHACSSGSV